MKSLKNYVILSVALIIAMVVIMAQGVQASSPTLVFGNNTNSTNNTQTTGNVGDGTNGVNANGVNAAVNQSLPTTTNNTVTVNSINTTKDPATTNKVNVTNTTSNKSNLPQTGENDVYIVTAIGAVALIIGGIAYVKSRKYDM